MSLSKLSVNVEVNVTKPCSFCSITLCLLLKYIHIFFIVLNLLIHFAEFNLDVVYLIGCVFVTLSTIITKYSKYFAYILSLVVILVYRIQVDHILVYFIYNTI